jgi:hypothetical protein
VTVVQVLFMVITVTAIALLAESLSRTNYPVDTFNSLMRWAFLLGGLAIIIGTVIVPWASLRRSPHRWPASVLRVAPFLGLASVVGSVLGFITCGLGANALVESIWGPIWQNSLIEIPIVAVSLIGLLMGSIIGALAAAVASKKGVA